MGIIRRTEHGKIVDEDVGKIKAELAGIDWWLEKGAPEEVKFELSQKVDKSKLDNNQVKFLYGLATEIEQAPKNADGEWFHKAIYELKETSGLEPKELFSTLYQVLIGKDSGPRAGYFLSILDRDWLVKRLRLKK